MIQIVHHNSKMGNNCSPQHQDREYCSSNPDNPHSQPDTNHSNQSNTLHNPSPSTYTSQYNDTFLSPHPPTTTPPVMTTKSSNESSSLFLNTHNEASNINLLPVQRISKGNIFKSTEQVAFAVQIYHQNVQKQCRIIKVNDHIIHHVCIEKYQSIRKHDNNFNEHLCKALHIARRKTDDNGNHHYLVTESIQHTCDSSAIISTSGSRKIALTTKLMSSGIREYIQQDPFHLANHIGNFVEK